MVSPSALLPGDRQQLFAPRTLVDFAARSDIKKQLHQLLFERHLMVSLRTLIALLALSAASVLSCPAAAQALAQTPPMGWNSWNHFASKVDDATIRATADALVSSGMRDAGYIYVNIDDTWEGTRDAQGVIHTNSKFPDMKALADYVHSKGLKLGIYSSPGAQT